jgi:anti-anti-sigma factor
VETLTIELIPGTPEGVRIIRLAGPFTLTSIWEFQSLIRDGTERITIVDFNGVPYMDSAALGSVMGLHASCQRLQRKYGLAGVNARLQTLFTVAGVNGILATYPTVEDALRSLTVS